MLKAPRLFLCLNGRETYAYIPPEVVTRACEMDSLTYLRAYSPYILLLMFLLHMGIMNNRRKKQQLLILKSIDFALQPNKRSITSIN